MTKSDRAMVKQAFKLAGIRLAELVCFLVGTGLVAFVVFHVLAFR